MSRSIFTASGGASRKITLASQDTDLTLLSGSTPYLYTQCPDLSLPVSGYCFIEFYFVLQTTILGQSPKIYLNLGNFGEDAIITMMNGTDQRSEGYDYLLSPDPGAPTDTPYLQIGEPSSTGVTGVSMSHRPILAAYANVQALKSINLIPYLKVKPDSVENAILYRGSFARCTQIADY